MRKFGPLTYLQACELQGLVDSQLADMRAQGKTPEETPEEGSAENADLFRVLTSDVLMSADEEPGARAPRRLVSVLDC
jgi:hypothetical protein